MKQIFKGHWGLYHISVTAILVLSLLAGSVRLYWAYLGSGYTVSATATLPYAQSQLWRWAISDQLRPLWQTGVYDVARLYGDINEIESTRQVFMIDKGIRTQAIETTTEVEANLRIRLWQETEQEIRTYTLTLRAIGDCQTEVTIHEAGVLHDFWATYFLFWTNSGRQERVTTSLGELGVWMEKRGEPCVDRASD